MEPLGLALPRHWGELIKRWTHYVRPMFKVIILYGPRMMLSISRWPLAEPRSPPDLESADVSEEGCGDHRGSL